jgi:transcriptional regulator with XRE-family HTH domain
MVTKVNGNIVKSLLTFCNQKDTFARKGGFVVKINDNIKRARLALRMSQDDLAEAIGASRVTISKYENGHFLPSVPALEKLASALGTTPAALTDSDPPPVSEEITELVAIAKRADPAHVRAAAQLLRTLTDESEIKKA